MKLNNWLYASAALLVLASCGDDWNEDKLDGFVDRPGATDVKKIEYTLTDADYKTIATNKTNKALAEADGVADELAKLTSNKYFTDKITAAKYAPAFLSATYPMADNKSAVKLTYNKLVGEPAYVTAIAAAKNYTLTDADYESVWGQVVKAPYLSPKTENRIGKILKTAMPNAVSGDIVMVDYAFSETEPSVGGGGQTADPTWKEISLPVRAAGNSWNYVNVGPVNLSEYKGMTVNIGFKYTSTAEKCGKWELKNYKVLTTPYLDILCFAKQKDGSYKKIYLGKNGFPGAGEYLFVSVNHEGKYNVLGALPEDKAYGYAPAIVTEVAQGTIAATAAPHAITVETAEGGYYLKDAKGRYLYLKGTFDSFNTAQEVGNEGFVWVISDKFQEWLHITNVDLKKTIKLNYYVNKDNEAKYSFGCYADDKVAKATLFANTLCGDEAGFTVNDINLGGLDKVWTNDKGYGWIASAQKNKVNYAAETVLVSPAIEIPDNAVLPYFTIDEALNFGNIDQVTVMISTDYAALAPKAATRLAYGCNRTGLYVYDGSSWSKHAIKDVKLDVMQPAAYASLGVGYLKAPAQVLPTYLKNNYPYAQVDDKMVVAYYASETAAVAAKECIFNGTDWTLTEAAVPVVDQFVKNNGQWVYDPSVVIDLPAGKGQPLSTQYFQAMTDWVWEHVDQANGITQKGKGYVTSYGNNEYYTGASAYQGNMDWRAAKAKEQYPDGYKDMEDKEIVAKMQEHFIEVMSSILPTFNPDAKMVDGVDVLFTINFAVYDGKTTSDWTVVFKVVGDAKFEYVEGSLNQRG